MQFSRYWIAGAIVALATFPQSARADIVFSNFSPAAGSGFTGSQWTLSGTGSGSYQALATSFVPSANYTLTSVEVGGFHFGGTNSYPFSIVNDSAGVPGNTILSSGTITTWSDTASIGTFTDSIALNAGTTYWLVGDAGSQTSEGSWTGNSIGEIGFKFKQAPGDPWVTADASDTPAFRINGTLASSASAPEPGTLGFLALGGVCVLARRRARGAR